MIVEDFSEVDPNDINLSYVFKILEKTQGSVLSNIFTNYSIKVTMNVLGKLDRIFLRGIYFYRRNGIFYSPKNCETFQAFVTNLDDKPSKTLILPLKSVKNYIRLTNA